MDPVLAELMSPALSYDLKLFNMMSMGGLWNQYIGYDDVAEINRIVTSARLAGNAPQKLGMIKTIMEKNGFKRFAGGTNRVVYRHLEDSSFLAKVAIDKTGMGDNPAEMEIQDLLKPYCTKMFQITPCGTIGFAERVMPIRNIMEFENVAEDIFNIINRRFLGKYILEDVGTKYFMNWGIRQNFGPVLLDYPYVYELDGAKLICNAYNQAGDVCGGEIDYDDGFNELRCMSCGCRYDAVQLKRYTEDNSIIIVSKGGNQMNVVLRNSEGVIIAESGTIKESAVIEREPSKKHKKVAEPQVTLNLGNTTVESKPEAPAVDREVVPSPVDTGVTPPVRHAVPHITEVNRGPEPEAEEPGEFCVKVEDRVQPGEKVTIKGVTYEIAEPEVEPAPAPADISVDGKFIPPTVRERPKYVPQRKHPSSSMGDY